MKRQKTEDRIQKSEYRQRTSNQIWSYLFSIFCFLSFVFSAPSPASEEKWPGVDKAVVENIAKEHGRETKKPLINTDQGDLLLFVFLLAGAAGGFAAGYYWRILLERKKDK